MEAEKNFLNRVWEVLEAPFMKLGLMDSALSRFLVVGGLTFTALYYFKPNAQFYNGEMRPFSLFSDDKEATPFPIYIVALLFGISSVVLI